MSARRNGDGPAVTGAGARSEQEQQPDQNLPDPDLPDRELPDRDPPDREPPEEGQAGPVAPPVDAEGTGSWRRLLRPRLRRVEVAVAVLLAVLGFAAATQVRSTQEAGPLAAARQEDLVQILDELRNRDDRLRSEIATLEQTRREITTGSDRSAVALEEARRRTQLLGVLAGTIPARGPGVRLTISDPENRMTADVLLNALEELRAAGAEAVQLEGPVEPGGDTAPGQDRVRVVASTSFVDGDQGGVEVDGKLLQAPFRFSVIGEPDTLAIALGIPGGAVADVEQRGGRAVIERSEDVLVGALRPLDAPRYARPAE